MGVFGCTNDGNLNDAKFSKPLPWIGIYIAAASLACLIAMVADAIYGIRRYKFWFPCKFFSLNSTSLTLIAVAIKLSVDLNTSMPKREDQLAKLSSTVLMCTIMGNSMPSLGTMANKEIFVNIMAFGILVITLVVNVCIELGTGVIYVFWKEHAFILFLMLVLLVILSFSALTIPTTKRCLEMKYNMKHNLALKEGSQETVEKTSLNKLREDMVKYWIMAHTCCPQFVLGRSATCTASGAICLLSAAIFAEAVFKSYLTSSSFKFCSGESDYGWTTTLILIVQSLAVGIGTIAPAFRWFMAIKNRRLRRSIGSYKKEFTLESYWIQSLIEMKDCPLTLRIQNQHCRKLTHVAKNKFLDICIRLQTAIVFISKVIRLISILFVSGIFMLSECFISLINKFSCKNTVSTNYLGSEPETDSKLDLGSFVLHLEGEDELVQLMVSKSSYATIQWIQMGKRRQPEHLIRLLERTNFSKGLKGVVEFDSHRVPSLDSEEPPNCWALPVVTLTSIAIALPNISRHLIKQLVSAVNESLPYVRLIQDHLDMKGDSVNLKKVADIVWLGVDIHHEWLDIDLNKISHQRKNPKENLKELSDCAKKRYMDQKNVHRHECFKVSPSNWPVRILAANSMYRISESILLKYENRCNPTSEELFASMTAMISDILGACLTNLQQVISIKCLNSTIEEREKSVREAVYILGKTEKILRLTEQSAIPNLNADQTASIDEWRLAYRLESSPSCAPSSLMADTAHSSMTDVYLTIEPK